jgi:NAD(P)-dependent dehydrogenase (short-subunit alcohol dehydrogenase family)
MWSLAGRTALITGASGDFGAHFAMVLARAGARVILAARREDAVAVIAERVAAAGGSAETARLDVSDSKSIAALSARFGSVDILVNNAGIERSAAALEQSEADWDEVLDTNLKGAFLVAQAMARGMRESGRGGSIINIASILGLRQAGTVLPYAVSKAGLIQMTKILALELARYDIRVNAIAPGYFATELNDDFWKTDAGAAMLKRIPTRRLGQLDDLDGPLLLLASDASRHMTGTVLTVDGGHLLATL